MFKKRTTGVEINEFFMRVGESPDEAVKRALKEYDLPEKVYFDKSRNILKTVEDGNSISVDVPQNSRSDDKVDLPKIHKEEELNDAPKTETSGKQDTFTKFQKQEGRVKFGKASDIGMGLPITKKVDDVDLDSNALKSKPFFKKKSKPNVRKEKDSEEFDLAESQE